MSSVSRIEKMVCEAGEAPSLAIAAERLARPLEIRVGPAGASSAIVLAPAALSLALRCFRGPIHVVIDGACETLLGCDGLSLKQTLAREAAAYGAESRLSFVHAPNADGLMTLGVGEPSASVMVNAVGWTCLVNATSSSMARAAAPAAALAAAIGIAKLFGAHVLGRPLELDEVLVFDLWSLKAASDATTTRAACDMSMGRIHLLGAGAIGNAFGWVLRAAGWRCLLYVIDHDRYDLPNEETSVMIGSSDVLLRPEKAPLLAKMLKSERVATVAAVRRIDEQSVELTTSCDVFVCAVDNVETRRTLDRANAGVILNAAVGDGRDTAGVVLCTRHGRDDWALSDAYRQASAASPTAARVPTEFAKDECSRVAYEGVSLAAPFAAMAAASLLAARAAHYAAGHHPDTSEIEFDLFRLVSRYRSRDWRRAA